MKVTDQARLWFREGNSDKVYEIDLVEVAAGQFVVNFRYGRRGSTLRDGTKTAVPVPLAKARATFDALVDEKTKGGYRPISGSASAPTPSLLGSNQKRAAAFLLTALAKGTRSEEPIHLVVRKVGTLGLREAEPLLLELLRANKPPTPRNSDFKPATWRHLLIAALARCGSSTSIAPLQAILREYDLPLHLGYITRLALTMIWGDAGRAEVQTMARALIPAALRVTANAHAADAADGPYRSSGGGPSITAIVSAYEQLATERPQLARDAIFGMYLLASPDSDAPHIDDEARVSRQVVFAAARLARFERSQLGTLRTLHRAAEIRRDPELFALLARRFEERDNNPQTRKTLDYFRRRTARVLRQLGATESPDYVRFAEALVRQYRDEHAQTPRETDHGRWGAFAYYHALNFVLYDNSPRYEKAGHQHATWRCAEKYQLGDPAPAKREEAYPKLWDRAPDALWSVGTSAAATLVIEFATRALRAQKKFLTEVPDEDVADAMANDHRLMRQLAFDIARDRTPNTILIRGALQAGIVDADRWVIAWVGANPQQATTSPELLALLVTARAASVRDAIAPLTAKLTLSPDDARQVVGRIIATLMTLPTLDEQQTGDGWKEAELRAASAVAFLLRAFPAQLEQLGSDVIVDLIERTLEAVANLGGELALRLARRGPLPAGLLDRLLASGHPAVRAAGAKILAATPASIMKDEPDVLVSFALSPNAELRAGTRSLFRDVAQLAPDVGRSLATRLLDALLKKQSEGAPAHVVSLLRNELAAFLPKLDAAAVLAYINALSPHAREAGGLLLAHLGAELDLGLDDIVRLASHEILAIRQGAWALATAAKDRFALAPVAIARLCDARWEDSRAFAFDFVRGFAVDALIPDAVIAICDSVNPAVQAFGQQLLQSHWQEQHAARYLVRLSEHPSTNIQLLVSGLLDRYASGQLDRIAELLPYLTTVLSQVNRGGVAKQRVLDFLRREAVASHDAAKLLAPLLDRQSATHAVSHRAPLIATMVEVHARHPDVALPIVVVAAGAEKNADAV